MDTDMDMVIDVSFLHKIQGSCSPVPALSHALGSKV